MEPYIVADVRRIGAHLARITHFQTYANIRGTCYLSDGELYCCILSHSLTMRT